MKEREREKEREIKRKARKIVRKKSERAKERNRERRHKSIVVHGDTRIHDTWKSTCTCNLHTPTGTYTHIYTRTRICGHKTPTSASTWTYTDTQGHAILYIYDSIDDGAAHSHSVSRIVPQNFSFEFASRNLLFSNV